MTYIYFLLYIISIITLGVFAMVISTVHEKKPAHSHNGSALADINRKKREEIETAKAKIILMLEEKHKITNNDVETLLGVSDATATNYLQALEEEDKIQQIGNRGRFVIYAFK